MRTVDRSFVPGEYRPRVAAGHTVYGGWHLVVTHGVLPDRMDYYAGRVSAEGTEMTETQLAPEPVADRELHALLSLLETEPPRSVAVLLEQMRGFSRVRLLRLAELAAPSSPAIDALDLLLSEHDAVWLEAEFRRWREQRQGLERAMELIARTRYPRLEEGAISRRLDDLARELRPRLPLDDSLKRLKAMAYCLHTVLGFHGNASEYYSPDNSLFNRVLDVRLGLPISLSVLYILLGRRLGLKIGGIGLPGHFVAALTATPAPIYFDPFHDGVILTPADLVQRVTAAGYTFHPEQLRQTSALRIAQRTLANLETAYELRHDDDRALLIQRLRVSL